MTVIQLTKLRSQIAKLGDLIGNPPLFLQELQSLLDFYSDRSRRHGANEQSVLLLPQYHTPPPVMRSIKALLSNQAEQSPKSLLHLADALWQVNYLEAKQLSAHILSILSVSSVEESNSRIHQWLSQNNDSASLDVLLQYCVNQETHEIWSEIAAQWLEQSPAQQHSALQILIAQIEHDYQNLPKVFSLLHRYLSYAPPFLLPEIKHLILKLNERSSIETVMFLKNQLQQKPSTLTIKLVRQFLPYCPKESIPAFRQLLQQQSQT